MGLKSRRRQYPTGCARSNPGLSFGGNFGKLVFAIFW